MNSFQTARRIAGRAGSLLALSTLLMGAGAAEADAQRAMAAKELTFAVEFPELAGRDGMDERLRERPLRADDLAGLLAREGRIVYGGEEPVEVRLVAFVVGERGEVLGRVVSEPFEMRPGTHRAGEHLPMDELHEVLRRRFPDSTFFPDGYFFPDDFFFPDSTFDEERFPDTIFGRDHFPDSTFDEVGVEDGQVGIVIVAAPTDEELQREARLGSSIVVFQTAPGDR